MTPPETPHIYVLAGVNGAGKSSIGGAAFRAFGADYYNPDEAARALMGANPGLSQSDANSAAWHQGKRLLEQAMARRLDFAFETTLGANTIPRLLGEAASQASRSTFGMPVCPVRSSTSSAGAPEFAREATTFPKPTSGAATNTAA